MVCYGSAVHGEQQRRMLTVTLTFLRSLHVRLCMLIFWLFLAFVNSRCQRTPVRFSNAGNTQANNGLLRCHRATRPVRQLSEYTDHVQHSSVHRKSRWVQTQRVVGLQSGDSSSSYLECLRGKSLTALTVVYGLVHLQVQVLLPGARPGSTYSSRVAGGAVIYVASGAGAADRAFGKPWILSLHLGQAVGDHRSRDQVRFRQLPGTPRPCVRASRHLPPAVSLTVCPCDLVLERDAIHLPVDSCTSALGRCVGDRILYNALTET